MENGGFGAVYGVPIGSLMIEQYINGKLTDGDAAKAAEIQKRHISYPFKRPLTHADSLRLDSLKRINAVKDSLKVAQDKVKMEQQKLDDAKKEKQDQEKKKNQPQNDPAIRVDDEVKPQSEERKDNDKDKKPQRHEPDNDKSQKKD